MNEIYNLKELLTAVFVAATLTGVFGLWLGLVIAERRETAMEKARKKCAVVMPVRCGAKPIAKGELVCVMEDGRVEPVVACGTSAPIGWATDQHPGNSAVLLAPYFLGPAPPPVTPKATPGFVTLSRHG